MRSRLTAFCVGSALVVNPLLLSCGFNPEREEQVLPTPQPHPLLVLLPDWLMGPLLIGNGEPISCVTGESRGIVVL